MPRLTSVVVLAMGAAVLAACQLAAPLDIEATVEAAVRTALPDFSQTPLPDLEA